MDTIDMLDKLNALRSRLECGMMLLFCIREAMERGSFDGRTFAPAVAGTYEYLNPVCAELCQIAQSVSGQISAAAD